MAKMTFEEIKQKLIEKGATKAQAESKTLQLYLSVISDDDILLDAEREEAKLKNLRFEQANLFTEIGRLERYLKDIDKRVEEKTFERIGELNNIVEYINKFNDALSKMETPEQRDRLRMAQLFKNSINIRTAYDNTAYIKGLSYILTGMVTDLDEIKKVEKRENVETTDQRIKRLREEPDRL